MRTVSSATHGHFTPTPHCGTRPNDTKREDDHEQKDRRLACGLGHLRHRDGSWGWPCSPRPTATAADSDLAKREEDRVELVLVDDRDDDDTNDDTGTGNTGNTGNSGTGNSNDATNSRFTAVSRDRDLSRGDKTRDWTKDGSGDRKRDWSANKTNDVSRNDTRG